jgi:hypothetical protein
VKNIGQHNNMQCVKSEAAQRGGNWSNSSNAGLGCVNLNNNRTNSNNNVGGRDSTSKPETTMVDTGSTGICCPAISEIKKEISISSSLTVEGQAVSKKSKRIGFLYEKTFTKENLYDAYIVARAGKIEKWGTFYFETHLGSEINKLYKELKNDTYTPKPYKVFKIKEGHKRRTIYAPHFRDLVVQHAIYKTIYPIFDRKMIDASYACRKGKGTHKASDYTQKHMRKYDGNDYFAKLDIKGFFYNITRSILKKFFEKYIKDTRFVNVMCMFSKMITRLGIPIGNLLSQIYALMFLNPLDHFIKRVLKVKSYVRYVDDFVMIGLNIEQAKEFKKRCEDFVKEKLNLQLSHWHIQKIKRGINFVGYRTWKKIKFVRKHSIYKMKRAIKKLKIESIVSLIGHAKGTGTIPFYVKLLTEFQVLNLLPIRSKRWLSI